MEKEENQKDWSWLKKLLDKWPKTGSEAFNGGKKRKSRKTKRGGKRRKSRRRKRRTRRRR